jgi:hypothetical protein
VLEAAGNPGLMSAELERPSIFTFHAERATVRVLPRQPGPCDGQLPSCCG